MFQCPESRRVGLELGKGYGVHPPRRLIQEFNSDRLDQTLPHEDKLCAVSTDLNTSGNDELLQIRFRE